MRLANWLLQVPIFGLYRMAVRGEVKRLRAEIHELQAENRALRQQAIVPLAEYQAYRDARAAQLQRRGRLSPSNIAARRRADAEVAAMLAASSTAASAATVGAMGVIATNGGGS